MISLLVNATRKWLVFSGARSNQGGTGHLRPSMRNREEWQRLFEEAGMIHMPGLSQLARMSAYPERSWDYFSNLLVFKHPSNPAEDILEKESMLEAADKAYLAERREGEQPKEQRARYEAATWPSLIRLRNKAVEG